MAPQRLNNILTSPLPWVSSRTGVPTSTYADDGGQGASTSTTAYGNSAKTPTTTSTNAHNSPTATDGYSVGQHTTIPQSDRDKPSHTSLALPNGAPGPHDPKPEKFIIAAVVGALMVALFFGAFFFMRKQRRRKAASPDPQMAQKPAPTTGTRHEAAFLIPTATGPLSPTSSQPSARSARTLVPPPAAAAGAASVSQHVVLSDSMIGFNSGLDTSDHISLQDETPAAPAASADPFADPFDPDAPPPPYRPSSLPSLSRHGSSARASLVSRSDSRATARGTAMRELRSPFEDPEV